MIHIKNLRVAYGGTLAVEDLSLSVSQGEFLTLLGPSGCGKSTLLRTIGGFVKPESGSLEVSGRDVLNLDPESRQVGFVFQNYALFPHLTVADNVAFGLKAQRVPRSERETRVRDALEMTDLTRLAKSRPAELSGGQQQRVAIARVLVTRPTALLMDEPLSNLDARLRIRLRAQVRELHDELGITTIYVTHDQDEALAISDRIAVMQDGRIEQIGTPLEIYHQPKSSYVCQFVGDANELTTQLATQFGLKESNTRRFVRPERVILNDHGEGSKAQIVRSSFGGNATEYVLDIEGTPIRATEQSSIVTPLRKAGATTYCTIRAHDVMEVVS